jgi:beta-glucosidase
MSPENIQHALERLHEKYHLPIIITENGLADATDEQRQWWITQTLVAMQKAMKNGVKLEGYLHWSLLDNFEWDKGFWPRFGLAHVDFKTKARTLRPSAVWFGKIIKYIRETQ